jgi:holo-[acyl-carrier protein] synthase
MDDGGQDARHTPVMSRMSNLSVGIDLVQVSAMADSVERFGERFLDRVFTPREIAYARTSPAQFASRLSARFAAKEAVRKALRLDGVAWRDIEVLRFEDGACGIALHGTARELARTDGGSLAVSLSHENDQAAAVVIATRDP